QSMGMAVMLDVVIRYVHSLERSGFLAGGLIQAGSVRALQNQIEFLSMKLSAASMYYDSNSPNPNAINKLQEIDESIENLGREGYGGFSYHFP
ncbi:hypothetical protein PanWU01x14_018980, partial [Parasponia andersonii]